MKRFNKRFSPPVEVSSPGKPRIWLWVLISLFTSFIIISIFLLLKFSFLTYSEWNVFAVFFFVFCGVLVIRFSLYERKVLFSRTWNNERERYIADYNDYMGKGLYLTHSVLLTGYGMEANAQIAWRGGFGLFKKNGENAAFDINRVVIKAKDAFYKFTSGCQCEPGNTIFYLLSNLEKEEGSHFVKAFSDLLHGFNFDGGIHVIDTNINPDFFDDWIDESDAITRKIIFLVIEKNIQPENENIMIFLFNHSIKNVAGLNIKVHRPVEYSGRDSMLNVINWSGTESIEGIWHSGAAHSSSAEIHTFIENSMSENKPKVINSEESFGLAYFFHEWFLLALASEWGRHSEKNQLIVSEGSNPVTQVISIC